MREVFFCSFFLPVIHLFYTKTQHTHTPENDFHQGINIKPLTN